MLRNKHQNLHRSQEKYVVKGFDWICSNNSDDTQGLLGSTTFTKFRMDDLKKKWKSKKCQSFLGFGERIDKLISRNPGLYTKNTRKIKEELFQKNLEEIVLKNKIKKMNSLKKVSQIYERQKKFRASNIDHYFSQQINWFKNCQI